MKHHFDESKLSKLLKPSAELQAGFERVNKLKLDLHTELGKEFSKVLATQESNELPMFGAISEKAQIETLRAKYPDWALASHNLMKRDTNLIESGDYLTQEDLESVSFAQLNLKKKLSIAFEALFAVAVEFGDVHENQKGNMQNLLRMVAWTLSRTICLCSQFYSAT